MAERQPPDEIPFPINFRPPTFQRRFMAAETDDPIALVALATDESYFVRRQALDNPNTPSWILDLLVRAGATPDLRGMGEIDPDLDPDSLRRLAETGPWAKKLVVEHPNTGADVLNALHDQPSIPIRLAIAAHPNSSEVTLAALCCDINDDVRSRALANARCPAELIQLLTMAGSSADLSGVIYSFGEITANDFSQLACLGPWGRFLIARHPDCPTELLCKITSDPQWRVRSGLLDNPNTPSILLEQILDAPSPDDLENIRCLSHPPISGKQLNHLAAHSSPEVRLALARHPSATTNILGYLATDGVKEIRRLAAAHTKTDRDVLRCLARVGSTPDLMGLSEPDSDMPADEIRTLLEWGIWARQLAVRHPNTDAETIARLLSDREPKIREWAAVHPNLSSESKRNLIRAGSGTDFQGIMPPDPNLPAEILYQISQLGSFGEWVVANNPYAPEELLDTLASADDWQVRMFVARNPSTTAPILNRLKLDPVEDVRLVALAATKVKPTA